MTDMQQYREAFIVDVRSAVALIRTSVDLLEKGTKSPEAQFDILRLFHSLKSSSAMMGYKDVSALCAQQEKIFFSVQEGENALTEAILAEAKAVVVQIETELKI